MQNIAKFEIRGNISKITTRDNVTFLDIAVNSSRKDENGEYQDEVEFISVTCWASHKTWADKRTVGDFVQIEGRIKPTEFERDGETQYSTTLAVNARAVLRSNRKEG